MYVVAGLEHLSSSNLLDMMDNGVILCHLAKAIQERAVDAVRSGLATGVSLVFYLYHLFSCINGTLPSIFSPYASPLYFPESKGFLHGFLCRTPHQCTLSFEPIFFLYFYPIFVFFVSF